MSDMETEAAENAAETPEAAVPSAEGGAPGGEAAAASAEATATATQPAGNKQWYVLKVQSGREDQIKESLEKRVKIQGVEAFFGEIIVPTEKVSEIKAGRKRVSERKFYPGYLMIHMEINEDTWFLIRETPGVGDFAGSGGRPVAMSQHEVDRMLGQAAAKEEEKPRLKIRFEKGETVKIKEGTFENFEGVVESVDEASGRITVLTTIFGRSTPVELEYWQVETME